MVVRLIIDTFTLISPQPMLGIYQAIEDGTNQGMSVINAIITILHERGIVK